MKWVKYCIAVMGNTSSSLMSFIHVSERREEYQSPSNVVTLMCPQKVGEGRCWKMCRVMPSLCINGGTFVLLMLMITTQRCVAAQRMRCCA